MLMFLLTQHTTSSVFYEAIEALLDFKIAASANALRRKIHCLHLAEIGQDNVEDSQISNLHLLC